MNTMGPEQPESTEKRAPAKPAEHEPPKPRPRRVFRFRAIKALKKLFNIPLSQGVLQATSRFLEQCNLTESSRNFASALSSRVATLKGHQQPHILITDSMEQPASPGTLRVAHLGDVLVALVTLIRGDFAGEITLALSRDDLPVGNISPALESDTSWRDGPLSRSYLLEIDKALRILEGRGVRVESTLAIPPFRPVPHRNQLLNTTPTLAALPEERVTLESYSTDKPEFLGYNYRFPDRVSYTFNSTGYRNDFEHDVSRPHSIVLGCSLVEGVGIPYEHTVSQRLQRLKGHDVLCLGCQGGSISYMYRSFLNHLAQRPTQLQSVYAVFTEIHRFEVPDDSFYFRNGVYSTVSAWSDEKPMKELSRVGVGFVYSSAYLTYLFLKEHCQRQGIPFSPVFYNYWNPRPEFYANVYGEDLSARLWGNRFPDLGRDGLHPGKRSIAELAELLYKCRPQG